MSRPVFLTGNLMRHVVTMSLTASIGIMAIFAVDFVDVMFISMLGDSALAAAVGYAGTLLFFTNSINIGLSIAAGALVAKSLGADKAQDAREYASSVSVLTFVISILVPVLMLANLNTLLTFLGAKGETLHYAKNYCMIILPSMCFMGLAMTSMAVLRSYGDARSSMFITLAGGLVNAVLDPILIFGFDLGLSGAAYASVTARACMMIFGFALVIKKYKGFVLPSFQIFRRDIIPVLSLAIPAVLTNLATPVGNAIITREMASFGTQAVAAMAVIGRLTPLAFAVVLALSGAIGPIVGQNFGAGKMSRVRGAFIDGLKFVVVYVLLAALLLFLLRGLIADMFDAKDQMRALIYLFCGPLALFQFFNGAIFVCNASYNNLGHPFYSTFLNWGRNTAGTLPFVLVGSSIAGASGILIGQAIGGIIFALIGLALAWRLIGKLDPGRKGDDFSTKEKRLHQVTCQRHW